MTPIDVPITQDALDRLEANSISRLDAALVAMHRVDVVRFNEIDRRLTELNNSHEKAAEEKKRTDAAALKVQENSVTRNDLQVWKDEVNRRLDLAAGAAKTWGVITGLGGSVLVGILIRYLRP